MPRPPIHLVSVNDQIRIKDADTHENDYTDPIRDYARQTLKIAPELCGYILVKGSPSCGYGRVKRYNEKGNYMASDQDGVFATLPTVCSALAFALATALAEFDPLLPLEDDGRLNDPRLRESFVTRACTYHAWKSMLNEGLTAHRLIEFYSRHKYLVMAHSVPAYRSIGRMVAEAGKRDLAELGPEFIDALMGALRKPATRRSHTNVLQHLAGYLKRKLSPEERQRLAQLIDSYRLGHVPLVVPVTMLRHHFANHPNTYIDSQVFLEPYPEQLQLRNQI